MDIRIYIMIVTVEDREAVFRALRTIYPDYIPVWREFTNVQLVNYFALALNANAPILDSMLYSSNSNRCPKEHILDVRNRNHYFWNYSWEVTIILSNVWIIPQTKRFRINVYFIPDNDKMDYEFESFSYKEFL